MARLACLVAGAALLTGCVDARDAAPAPTRAPSAALHVELIDERLTVRARDVSVGELVDEIARRHGLVVISREPLDERVSLELERLALPEALGRILRHYSFALQAAQAPGGSRNGAEAAEGKLWVFSRAPVETRASLEARFTDRIEASDALDAEELIARSSLALGDHDARARLSAVSTLAEVGDQHAVAPLTAAALSDGEPSVREEAAYALGAIGGQMSIDVLEQALIDPDGDVRGAAIDAFTQIGGDASARALAVALTDRDASLRADAVDALGEIGGETAIGLLRRALQDERSAIRDAAAEYLAELSSEAR